MLRKQQALKLEELHFQQRKQQLALKTEIAKVKAVPELNSFLFLISMLGATGTERWILGIPSKARKDSDSLWICSGSSKDKIVI